MPENKEPARAVIFGCESLSLTEAERRFFAEADPLGFILFARNVESPDQVRALVASLKDAVGRDAPILVDQEGGRVQRLKPPHWRPRPPMAVFGRIAERDAAKAALAARLNAHLIAADLAALGISADCAPLLDVPVHGAHDIIGDRAFSWDPVVVASLGRATMDGLLDGRVIPIVKHIPGHGRALVDSHHDLPVVEEGIGVLAASDFVPFKALADAPWAMTAHVVYNAVDPDFPATISAKTIQTVIRGEIGCSSLLLSDDLSMRALKGDFEWRARATLAAGCDLVLHCNGDMAEMQAVAKGARRMDDAALERFARGQAMLRNHPVAPNAQARLDSWLEEEAAP